eukprot:936337-Amphidinium_carterae.1
MPEETRKQYVTVTGEGLTIEGWKEVTLIIGAITMQICFIVANVQSPLLGLPDIDDNNVTVHTGINPHIERKGLHKPNEIKLDSSINSRYNPSLPTTDCWRHRGFEEVSQQQANIPKQLRQPPQPGDNHPNKNKVYIALHTCHTDLGVQSASRPKDNLHIIDAVD